MMANNKKTAKNEAANYKKWQIKNETENKQLKCP